MRDSIVVYTRRTNRETMRGEELHRETFPRTVEGGRLARAYMDSLQGEYHYLDGYADRYKKNTADNVYHSYVVLMP